MFGRILAIAATLWPFAYFDHDVATTSGTYAFACSGCTLTVSADVGTATALSGGDGKCHLAGNPTTCQQETPCKPGGVSFNFSNPSMDDWEVSFQGGGWTKLGYQRDVDLTFRANTADIQCGAPSTPVGQVRRFTDHVVIGNIYLHCNPCTS